MKARIFFPTITFLSIFLISSCRTQVHTQTVVRTTVPATKAVTVEALSDEVSYNLDLRAVATVFADSRNLEDFEYRLNDNNNGISNLDLNRDGYIDYLRVVEMYENNTRLVVVQSVLGYNVFQDVATIVVEGRNSSSAYVQIIGDPYIYGTSYIIQPIFYRTPIIYSSFWGPSYAVWRSPYYWGYYPGYWHRRAPIVTNVYVNNIHIHVNNNNNYNYTNKVRNQRSVNRMQTTVSRNDYARNNPSQSFSSRNSSSNVRNAREVQTRDAAASSSRNSNATTNSRQGTNTNNNTGTRGNSSSSSSRQNSGTSTSRGSSSTNRNNSATTNSSSGSSTRQTTTQPNNNGSSSTRQTTTQPSNSGSSSSRQTTTQPNNNSSSTRQTTTKPSNSSSNSSRNSGTSTSPSTSSRNSSSGTVNSSSRSSSSSSSSRSSGSTNRDTSNSSSSRSSGSSSGSRR